MSTLNKRSLKLLQKSHKIFGENYIEENLKSASYDLRAGTIYVDGEIISASHGTGSNKVAVKPSQIITLLTLEDVNIPNDCIGTVFALNSMSSTGFLILNPGHIDPGYKGPITICAINLSKQETFLFLGMPIFTIIISRLDSKLDKKELYQGNTFKVNERKEYEAKQLNKRFRLLSSSFFDLITGYDGYKQVYNSIVLEKVNNFIKSTVRIILLLSAVATIVSAAIYFIPENRVKLLKEEIKEKDSVIKKNIDSIDLLKEHLKEYKFKVKTLENIQQKEKTIIKGDEKK
jgi:deoxycytidine triphosphate deaminase